mmetsp:Transcript_541/g.678  ORF Transcript_541/g.678 Transcript_541/m.678 type:complete len:542 (-) Transcript_541:316-1941(-)|eukprot:CAMPEP_0204830784 /NCGR_PEP_ID=MMETSP1346-20131115/9264_1 /ASSEMBLY_ACC=CAM_ASM_000771 /TAXON_ID=215587 /ORGANISM="Aplanochytrium stocchinoi, Strain GSBS06" /LENGTH=541 /DNA_ID=CAMNT_0051961315 /DNA_START=294 /DNA_END=1919 /DNA_ORIENTATION=-
MSEAKLKFEAPNQSSRSKNIFFFFSGFVCCGFLLVFAENRHALLSTFARTDQYYEDVVTLNYVDQNFANIRKYGSEKLFEIIGNQTIEKYRNYGSEKASEIIEKFKNSYGSASLSGIISSRRKQNYDRNDVSNMSDSFLFLGDDQFGQKLTQTCGYWLDQVDTWKMKAKRNNYQKRFYAHQQRSGTGDRLAGALTALNHAMTRGEILDVAWTKLYTVFKPSFFVANDPPLINYLENAKSLKIGSCKAASYYKCSYEFHKSDRCPVYNRACTQEKNCEELVDRYGSSLNMAHVLGCQMRLMFQPTKKFMNHNVSLFVNNTVISGPLVELISDIKQKYETIAVHLRLGDYYMRGSIDGDPVEGKEFKVARVSKECIDKVDAFVSNKTSSPSTGNRKPVRWIIASDDPRIRNHFKEKFPHKVITLESKPMHVSRINTKSGDEKATENMYNLFAEWFLLGVADHMVTNNAHNFGVSAFSRSAWIYNLKSQYYEVDLEHSNYNCKKKEYRYQGAVNRVPQTCKDPSNALHVQQPHLTHFLEPVGKR